MRAPLASPLVALGGLHTCHLQHTFRHFCLTTTPALHATSCSAWQLEEQAGARLRP